MHDYEGQTHGYTAEEAEQEANEQLLDMIEAEQAKHAHVVPECFTMDESEIKKNADLISDKIDQVMSDVGRHADLYVICELAKLYIKERMNENG